jgi:AbrB family looped-hinge helix DNA binding protein
MKTIAQKVIPRVIPICYDFFMTQKVGPKGQVVIPKKIRDELGIEPGDEVIVSLSENNIIIQSVSSTKNLMGIFAGLDLLEILEEDHRIERNR